MQEARAMAMTGQEVKIKVKSCQLTVGSTEHPSELSLKADLKQLNFCLIYFVVVGCLLMLFHLASLMTTLATWRCNVIFQMTRHQKHDLLYAAFDSAHALSTVRVNFHRPWLNFDHVHTA